MCEMNQQLRVIQKWDTCWQVTFALEKTQAMMISRSPVAKPAVKGKLCFDGVFLALQEIFKILGVEVDQELRFDGHIKHIAQKASHWVTSLRKVAGFLDKGDKLYKAQYCLTQNMLPFRGCYVQPRTPGNWKGSRVESYDWWMPQTPHPSPSQRVSLTHWNTAGTLRR